MQYSAFEGGKVRKAGDIEAVSGRDIIYKNRLNEIDINRGESIHDDLFGFSSNKANNSRNPNTTNSNRPNSKHQQQRNSKSEQESDQDSIDLSKEEIGGTNSTRKSGFINGQQDENEQGSLKKESSSPKSKKNSKRIEIKSGRSIDLNRQNTNYESRFLQEDLFLVKSSNLKPSRTIESYENDLVIPKLELKQAKKNKKEKKKHRNEVENGIVRTDSSRNNSSRNEASRNETSRNETSRSEVVKFDINTEDDYDEPIEPAYNDFNLEYFKSFRIDTIQFVQTPPPLNVLIRCKIKINRGIFSDSYTMFLEESDTNSDLPLLTCKPKKVSAKIFYWIFVHENNEKKVKSKNQTLFKFGKVFSNVSRNKYILVGNLIGNNDANANGSDDDENNDNSNDISDDNEDDAKTYFNLEHNNKLIGKSKPKDIKLKLNLHPSNNAKEFELQYSKDEKSPENCVNLITKSPEYDKETKTYSLDFKGRAKLPSTNNLQIVDETDTQTVLLQLGKYEKNSYYIDYSFPFTSFTAFGLALSCLTRS